MQVPELHVPKASLRRHGAPSSLGIPTTHLLTIAGCGFLGHGLPNANLDPKRSYAGIGLRVKGHWPHEIV